MTMDQQTLKLLSVSGKTEEFPIWSTRFTALMQTKQLYKTLMGTEEQPEEPPELEEGATNPERERHRQAVAEYEKRVSELNEKSNSVWCNLALVLDTTTLMLIKHDCLNDNGTGNGTKAWKMLQERFQSVETPTVVSLVSQLARLQLRRGEDLDTFFIRGQELMTRLGEAGEPISETLFNAMILNGLPQRFEVFVIQESFNPAGTFTELRKRLQNFEESKVLRDPAGASGHIAMPAKKGRDFEQRKSKSGPCFVCGIKGHISRDCRKRNTAECWNCGMKRHLAKMCKTKTQARDANDGESKAMGSTSSACDARVTNERIVVDSGSTDHIVTNRSFFKDFEPVLSTVRNPIGEATEVTGKGVVEMTVVSNDGKMYTYELRDVLCVPGYQMNLLSVAKATTHGHSFTFGATGAKLVLENQKQVSIETINDLYMLKCRFRYQASSANSTRSTKAQLWHRRLGHLNQDDVKRTIPDTLGGPRRCM